MVDKPLPFTIHKLQISEISGLDITQCRIVHIVSAEHIVIELFESGLAVCELTQPSCLPLCVTLQNG